MRILFFSMLLALSGHVSFAVAAEEIDDSGFDERPIITVDNKTEIKIVYDAKANEWSAGIGKALFYVRGLYEAYRKQGVNPEDMQVSVVLHGPTVYWLLTDDAFQSYTRNPFGINPNHHVIESLVDLGVSLEACNSTMKSMGWFGEDLLPGVNIVHDGYTRMVELQINGYTYIHF